MSFDSCHTGVQHLLRVGKAKNAVIACSTLSSEWLIGTI